MDSTYALIRAARDVVDAFGGDVPDWLREEIGRLDAATAAAKTDWLKQAGAECAAVYAARHGLPR